MTYYPLRAPLLCQTRRIHSCKKGMPKQATVLSRFCLQPVRSAGNVHSLAPICKKCVRQGAPQHKYRITVSFPVSTVFSDPRPFLPFAPSENRQFIHFSILKSNFQKDMIDIQNNRIHKAVHNWHTFLSLPFIYIRKAKRIYPEEIQILSLKVMPNPQKERLSQDVRYKN